MTRVLYFKPDEDWKESETIAFIQRGWIPVEMKEMDPEEIEKVISRSRCHNGRVPIKLDYRKPSFVNFGKLYDFSDHDKIFSFPESVNIKLVNIIPDDKCYYPISMFTDLLRDRDMENIRMTKRLENTRRLNKIVPFLRICSNACGLYGRKLSKFQQAQIKKMLNAPIPE